MIFVALLIVLFFGVFKTGYRINTTNSYPLGIYRVTSDINIARNQTILFCAPKKEIFEVAHKRGYIPLGMCADGLSPLQKKIVGLPGDEVVVSSAGVKINGVLQKNSKVFRYDVKGRILPTCDGGKILPGEIFVMSDYNERSFDSRYFGSIPISNVIGNIEPVVLFNF